MSSSSRLLRKTSFCDNERTCVGFATIARSALFFMVWFTSAGCCRNFGSTCQHFEPTIRAAPEEKHRREKFVVEAHRTLEDVSMYFDASNHERDVSIFWFTNDSCLHFFKEASIIASYLFPQPLLRRLARPQLPKRPPTA